MRCSFCHKVFNKGEHLRRHERSHTGSKPFVCRTCKRAFGRQDSLMRHERLHTRPEQTLPQHSPSRIRPVTPETPPQFGGNSSDDIRAQSYHEASTLSSAQKAQLHVHSADLDFDLVWPDTEDLFQTILSSDAPNQWQSPLGSLPGPAEAHRTYSVFDTPSSIHSRTEPFGSVSTGFQAAQNAERTLSSSLPGVTAAADATPINPVFLDECLHMFFVRFIPTFPILHRPTFVFRDCISPLLLNAIAIGSLYLGPKASIAKGQALWRLAHTAIATSWQTLISHRGRYDACEGVQLMIAAVLGQLYGTLSGNRAIRTTSQTFHSLGFSWARQCGMFDCEPYPSDKLPALSASEEEKEHQWRIFVAREIQQRALLAHYVLDGLVAQLTGEPTSVRHATNPLELPSREATFEAATAEDWLSHMHMQTVERSTFRHVIRLLFRPQSPDSSRWVTQAYSLFSYKVLLEALQSLLSDCEDDSNTAVGVPTKSEIRRALLHLYESIVRNTNLTTADRLETLLRWHAICLDSAVDSSTLCQYVCQRYGVTQHIWKSSKVRRRTMSLDLGHWADTEEARRALLHAVAIQGIIEELPRGRAHAVHMPSALFAAATVYSVFTLAGSVAVKVPSTVVWQEIWAGGCNDLSSLADHSEAALCSDTRRYCRGETMFWASGTTTKNLLYDLNSIHKLFRCLAAQWGLASDMEDVVDQWISLCH